jgi:hypothetical protein
MLMPACALTCLTLHWNQGWVSGILAAGNGERRGSQGKKLKA